MLLTQDARLASRARHLSTQAKSSDAEYVHDDIGHNYRLTNIQAALGLSQMEILPGFLFRRRRVALWYREALPDVPVEPDVRGAEWNRWLIGVEVPDLAQRNRLLKRLNDAGIQARPLWRPVPMQVPYRDAPAAPTPAAKRAYETIVDIPSSSSLTAGQIERVAAVLRAAPLVRLLT